MLYIFFILVKKHVFINKKKQLKTHRTVQLPMINAPTNAIDGDPLGTDPHPL